jgi:phosphatidylglycerophosphate synthase
MRRASAWLLPVVPARVTPNAVTWAGFGALALAGASFALSRVSIWWLLVAALGLLAHALLDVIDGDLARARSAHSRRGVFLDLFCDNVGGALIGAGLMLCPYATMWIVGLAYAAYSAAATSGYLSLVMLNEMAMPEIGPTETEILLALIALVTLVVGGACLPMGPLCLGPLDVAALGWIVLAVRLTAVTGRYIYRRLG